LLAVRLYRFDQAVGRRVALHGSRFTQAALTAPGHDCVVTGDGWARRPKFACAR
jgi:hypothetical protein